MFLLSDSKSFEGPLSVPHINCWVTRHIYTVYISCFTFFQTFDIQKTYVFGTYRGGIFCKDRYIRFVNNTTACIVMFESSSLFSVLNFWRDVKTEKINLHISKMLYLFFFLHEEKKNTHIYICTVHYSSPV